MGRNHDIKLADFLELIKGVLSLATAEERYAARQEPVKFRIFEDTTKVVINGRTRPLEFVVTDSKIEHNALVIVICREFEEIEGYDGRK
jgi:hypothetical protein